MRTTLVFILLLWVSSIGLAEDRRQDRSRLVIMNFNAEFLWDGDAPEDGNDRVQFPWKGDREDARAHMADIARVINRNNPDIISLTEVESLTALETFNRDFLASRGYRAYLINGKDTFTGQDMGLLTRVDPIGELQREGRRGQSGTTTKSVSKNYIAKFQIGELKFAMIGIHLLSRPDSRSRRPQREAQARAIQMAAKDLHGEGFPLIIIGDFNDFDGEVLDHQNNMPITNVLSILKDVADGDEHDLRNAAEKLPKALRYTAFYDRNGNGEINAPGEYTMIDHILVSPQLFDLIDYMDADHAHDPRRVSDHFPLEMHLRTEGEAQDLGRVRITAMLPNPTGLELVEESVTIKNETANAVDLTGWILKDVAGRTWALDSLGTLAAGEEKTILRNNQAMALNNRGDTVDLIDQTGKVHDKVVYENAGSGRTLRFQ